MGTIDGRTWMEVLGPHECWALLDAVPVGRLAVLVDGAPEIYPINHVVDDGTVVFRTDAGSKLRGLATSSRVCFEVDGTDPFTRAGWSVVVKGRAVELHTAEDVRHAATLPLDHWAFGEKSRWVRIEPVEVTGRRTYRPQARS